MECHVAVNMGMIYIESWIAFYVEFIEHDIVRTVNYILISPACNTMVLAWSVRDILKLEAKILVVEATRDRYRKHLELLTGHQRSCMCRNTLKIRLKGRSLKLKRAGHGAEARLTSVISPRDPLVIIHDAPASLYSAPR
jgi:hypothetical protein